MIKMNVCFLIGKIVSKIKFDFILNGKNISIVRFDMELENCNKIRIFSVTWSIFFVKNAIYLKN